jgi:CBS domain-containing protein
MSDLRARHLINRQVTTATPRAIGCDLVLQLLSGMYSGLPAVDDGGRVVGVVTEFDLLKVVRDGKDLHTVKAEEIMSRIVVCAQEDDALGRSLHSTEASRGLSATCGGTLFAGLTS